MSEKCLRETIEGYLKKLNDNNKNVFVWFRDDDVGLCSEGFNTLVSFFERQKTDVLLAVIPKCLEDETIKIIKNSESLIVAQHGYSHINYSIGDEPKSEFPSSRNMLSSLEELEIGRSVMKKAFPEKYAEVLVPPYFEIDREVLIHLRGLYKWFSCWWENSVDENGVFVNAQVDFINWSIAKVYGGSYFIEKQFLRELIKLDETSEKSTVIGVVLHHDYCETRSYKELEWIMSLPARFMNVHIVSPIEAYDLVCSKEAIP